ncbi:MAG: hypothetical protein ABW278_03225 [Steroidobacteraceae bacterium]
MLDRKVSIANLQSQFRVDGLQNLAAACQGRGAILIATHSGVLSCSEEMTILVMSL